MPVSKLCIANVGKTITLCFVPSMSQLGLPAECKCRFNLILNHLADYIPWMHINSANSHNFLALTVRQWSQEKSDEVVQLGNLFLVIVFEGIFITLFKPGKGRTHLRSPPYLSSCQRNLCWVVKKPLVSWPFFISRHWFSKFMSDGCSHCCHELIQPNLNLSLANTRSGKLHNFSIFSRHGNSCVGCNTINFYHL